MASSKSAKRVLKLMLYRKLEELNQSELKIAELKADIDALKTIIGFEDIEQKRQSLHKVVPVLSHLDRLRNVIIRAGADGVTVDDVQDELKDRSRGWIRTELFKLAAKQDGVAKTANGRYVWTNSTTRKFGRQTLHWGS